MTKPKKKSNTKKFNLGTRTLDHLIHGGLIFTSVFLAFMLNECRIGQQEKKDTKMALHAITAEIRNNKALLEHWSAYHKEIIDNVTPAYAEEDEEALKILWEGDLAPEGIMRAIITNDAWNMARHNRITFDIKTSMALSRLYEHQEYTRNALQNLLALYNEREYFREELWLENFEIFMMRLSELYAQEVSLIQHSEEVLEVLEK